MISGTGSMTAAADKDGNIMLKANDYVNLSYKTLDSTKVGRGNTNYNIIGKSSRTNLINYIGTSSNWNEYAVSGMTTARGAMTIEEFVNGYNLVNTEKLAVEYLASGATSSDGAYTASADGYAIKKGTGNYKAGISGITEAYNGMKYYNKDTDNAKYMLLASGAAEYDTQVLIINSSVTRAGYAVASFGICPVVSLTNAKLIKTPNGTLLVQ